MPSYLARPNGQDLPLESRSRPVLSLLMPQVEQPTETVGTSLTARSRGRLQGYEGGQSGRQPIPIAGRPATAYIARRLTGPVQFLVRLLQVWGLSNSDARILLGYDEADQQTVDFILQGSASLRGRDARDRVASLIGIRALLQQLFRDENTEKLWLREPKESLYGKSPLGLMLEGSLENILVVRQWVERGAGL